MGDTATCNSFPRVKEVRAYTKKASSDQGADCHDVEDKHWINGHPVPIANPMSCYPLYQAHRKSWGINALGSIIVEVECEDGTVGLDPRNVELIWDQMFKGTLNYGRKGLPIQAISAVDLALWDALGKIRREPVYALLGGKTRDRLPVYCTTARPDIAQKHGFVAAKIPCAFGPSHGDEGLAKNVEIFRGFREQVGPDFPLMLDCYMALSVSYATRLANALQPYNLKWIEECMPPDDYIGYSELHRNLAGSCLLTTGEHEYTRYGFRVLLEQRCADILQPDITWVGGITEARRIVAMAASHDTMVIPHGSSVYSYHLQYAFPNCPLAEYINLSPQADKIVPYFGGLFTDEPLPENGFVTLPDRPGFGVTLNRDSLHRPYPRPAATKMQTKCSESTDVAKMPL
eukprot:Em0202g6a